MTYARPYHSGRSRNGLLRLDSILGRNLRAPTDAVRLVEKVFAVAKRFLYSPNEVPTQDCTETVADMSGSDLVMGSISSC